MAYNLFILLIAAERLVELVVSRRNARWSFAHGGKEFGRSHYPAMVSMHALLLVSCIVEVATQHRPFLPWLGWPMVALVAASTAMRWWCVATLGKHWNPRLIVIPNAELVQKGPYRLLHHPNYTAVAVEVAALPLVHSAWWTAVVFSLANAAILRIRITSENRALGYA
ncbi:isoprenylcysteine carboxyl methyltransferase family protein [Mycolicibacterium vaccae]|jgi:methyltransferase|uniref:Isoprenylcysteine carboxyl methyltransferase n=1 Tax=Mycolicibacterium vaccae ATCC 25954 TaxID=1194972 RepID=K0V905_MYCVA|nr:isoprenylcysteine carboxyl methyltransferase family protein [Mycolicibacterium vaccae]ANI38669.1 isoprenylcysteine carboxyl methyltransferase [Mycolicibacterium vaccae 95051]EJZ11358.1 isoprenylcysteine carboxyl methyltransferase [Mycolicibacterium vaccae ATCC 25954]MCV7063463.1 isoprenylcysteine carboxyl methyltransferase family protein [Mycolicibacterium vaccae]